MNKIISSLIIFGSFVATSAYAGEDQNIGDLGRNIGQSAEGLGTGAVAFFGAVAIICLLVGAAGLYGAFQSGDKKMKHVGLMILGVVFASPIYFLGVASSTVTGSDQSTEELQSLGIE